MRIATKNRMGATARPGLTLVELLVVMTIIAILASLSISEVFALRESQTKSFTETTVSKLASLLDTQWKAALDQIKEESIPLGVIRMAGGDMARAKRIYLKARLKQEFPVTIDMAKNPVNIPNVFTLPAKDAYAKAFASITSSGNTEWEGSALLFLTLSQARRGVSSGGIDELDPSCIQQQGAFKIFVDSWGKPLRYYVFPYYNDELNGPPYVNNVSGNAGRDPQDPEGLLGGFSSSTFTTNIHPLDRGVRHLIPVVASAGRDAQWGIDQLYMRVTDLNQANDNIYSYRLRKFGARGD